MTAPDATIVTRYEYDDVGNLVTRIDANNRRWEEAESALREARAEAERARLLLSDTCPSVSVHLAQASANATVPAEPLPRPF